MAQPVTPVGPRSGHITSEIVNAIANTTGIAAIPGRTAAECADRGDRRRCSRHVAAASRVSVAVGDRAADAIAERVTVWKTAALSADAPVGGQRTAVNVVSRHVAGSGARTASPGRRCGHRRSTAVSAISVSSRARAAPRQKCGPCRKARWPSASRPTSSASGSGKTRGSRLAAPSSDGHRAARGDRHAPDDDVLAREARHGEQLRAAPAQQLLDGGGRPVGHGGELVGVAQEGVEADGEEVGGHLPGEHEVPDERDDLGVVQRAGPDEVGDEAVLRRGRARPWRRR